MWAALACEALGKRDNTALRRRIAGIPMQAAAALARNRRDVDDSAIALLDHQRKYGLRAQEHALQIDGERSVPCLDRNIRHRSRGHDPGIVHENVDSREALN